jgi:hypothetical protein
VVPGSVKEGKMEHMPSVASLIPWGGSSNTQGGTIADSTNGKT